MKGWIVIWLIFGLAGNVFSQVMDSILLEEVEIKRFRIRDSAAVEVLPAAWLAIEGTGGLSASLQQYSSAFVKNFGPGGLSTVSLDGLNPQHTATFWNGIPVNNSITGVADLSIYPLSSGLNVKIPAANGMMEYTSGQIGGLLWLESAFSPTAGMDLSVTSGSFGRWEVLGSGQWSADSTAIKVKLDAGYRSARNEYDFKDYNRDPVETGIMKHAAFDNYFIEPGLLWKSGTGHSIRMDAHFSRTQREIPPSVITPNNRADSKDHALRISNNWQVQKGAWTNDWTTGYTYDVLSYREVNGSAVILKSSYDLHQVRLGERLARTFDRHSLSIGGQLSYYIASGEQLKRTGLAAGGLFAGWQSKWAGNHLVSNVVLRTEFHSESEPAVAGQADLVYQPSFRMPFSLFFTGARNSKFPSLGDLYFLPSGNAELDKEASWKVKGGYRLDWKNDHWDVNHDASGYMTWLEDMILWVPTSKQYWRPVNLRSVRARGLYLKNTVRWSDAKNKWDVSGFQAYRFAISTNEENLGESVPLFPNDLTVGKQLPYLPRHQFKAHVSLGYAGVYLLWQSVFTSERYITGSNSYFLEKYWLTNLGAGYRLDAEHYKVQVQFRVKNLLNNTYYQEVAHVPMPPRNYEISMRFGYHR